MLCVSSTLLASSARTVSVSARMRGSKRRIACADACARAGRRRACDASWPDNGGRPKFSTAARQLRDGVDLQLRRGCVALNSQPRSRSTVCRSCDLLTSRAGLGVRPLRGAIVGQAIEQRGLQSITEFGRRPWCQTSVRDVCRSERRRRSRARRAAQSPPTRWPTALPEAAVLVVRQIAAIRSCAPSAGPASTPRRAGIAHGSSATVSAPLVNVELRREPHQVAQVGRRVELDAGAIEAIGSQP